MKWSYDKLLTIYTHDIFWCLFLQETAIDPQELLQLQQQQADQLSPSDVILPPISSGFHVIEGKELNEYVCVRKCLNNI